jgi:hypothetical protein
MCSFRAAPRQQASSSFHARSRALLPSHRAGEAESGASIWKLSEVSRHTLRGYVQRVDLFKEHAGAAFL